jgi:hypothetical protein
MDDVKNEGAAPSAAKETVNPYAAGKLTPEISRKFLARAQGEQTQDQPERQDTATADTSKETKSEDDKSKSAAAPDSAKETQDKDKGSRRKPSAEERIAELIAENKRLKEGKGTETHKAEPVARQPEAKAAPVEELKAPVKPKFEDFEKLGPDKAWEAFEAAKDKYVEDLIEYNRNKAIQDFKRQASEEAQTQQLTKELAAARERYKDFDTVVAPLWTTIATDKAIHPMVQEFVGRSAVMVDLMYAIGGDAATMKSFVDAAKTDPFTAMRYAMKAEELVIAELAKGKGAKTEEKSGEKTEPEDKKNPANKKTEEPQPTREVGNRGTGPNDTAADEVRRGQGKLTKALNDAWTRKAAERQARG